MESKDDLASVASERLREFARLESSASERRPSRGYWWLMLWSAVLIAAYVGVYLFTFGGSTVEEVSDRSGGYSATWVMLTPVLAFSSLLSGARERFSIRAKPSPLHWVCYGLVMAGFVALGVLSITGIAYPWWLNVLVPLVLFFTMAATPVRNLAATSRGSSTSWGNAPLSVASRLMTMLIGLAIGVLLVTSANPLAAAISGIVVMVFLIVVLVSWRSSFGLPRVGYQWGSIHWVCFGACAAIVFACVLLTTFTSWFTASYNVAAGILVFIIMGVAAVLPRRDAREL